jgi:hypothetical protein
MDTGPKVQGRALDIYIWSCHEALAFGRKPVQVSVLRLGWNPSASSPSLVDRLFRRREAARNAAPPVAPTPAFEPAAVSGEEGPLTIVPPPTATAGTEVEPAAAEPPVPADPVAPAVNATPSQ